MIEEILAQPDSSMTMINLDNNLDFIEYTKKYEVFENVLRKLKKGGVIELRGIDINILSKLLINDLVNLDNINQLIGMVKSVDSILQVERFLINHGFKLTKRGIENEQYILAARHQM